MKLTEASKQDIDAMSARLNEKKEARKTELEMEEAIRMVQKRPFVKAPTMKKNVATKREKLFLNGLALVWLAFVGAILWDLTDIYFFLIFTVAVLFMAAIEFKKSFT